MTCLSEELNIVHSASGWVTADGMVHMYEYCSYEEVVKHAKQLKEKECNKEVES